MRPSLQPTASKVPRLVLDLVRPLKCLFNANKMNSIPVELACYGHTHAVQSAIEILWVVLAKRL